MAREENDPKIQIRCSEQTKREYKARCNLDGVSMQDDVLTFIEGRLNGEPSPVRK